MRSPEAPKAPKEGKSLRDIAVELSSPHLNPAQVAMRHDMEMANMVKAAQAVPITAQPQTVLDVFDGMMGPQSPDARVAEVAHMLIEEHGAELRLGLKEFAIVQRIVEAAVRFEPADL